MRWVLTALGAALFCGATPASAGIYADDLSRCLVRSTSAEDRIAFTQWMFSAMSTNPNVAGLANVTTEERASYSRTTALLMQRLLLDDCRAETIAAIRYEGEATIATSFEVVGRVAMAELMNDPAVAAELSGLGDSLDEARWEDLMAEISPSQPATE
ncbi:MAG: hypothetical protein K2X61_10365 [Caulobacteraceae bacterium]|nr:hypothetical protein [Caulobacteraceae bacterium]